MLVLPKIFTREFPLAFCQIWGRAYTRLFGKPIRTFPRNVFVVREGMAEDYRNPQLTREINDLFYIESQGKIQFFQKLSRDGLKKFKILGKYWNKKFLTKKELREFGERVLHFWKYEYAALYLPNDQRFRPEIRQLMTRLRANIEGFGDAITHIVIKTLEHLYPGLGQLVSYVSLQDLDKPRINKKKLQKLAKKPLIMIDDQMISEKEFRKLRRIYNFKLEKTLIDENVKIIKGHIAYKGSVSGEVKLLLKRAEVSNFEQGRILVSAMTSPDYLPAMRKAAAFVTDEGGITCHAAIVARELKKPCIIGTKIATQVFKDGDLVEVDADRGVVRKL